MSDRILNGNKSKYISKVNLSDYSIIILVIVTALILYLTNDFFGTYSNIMSVLRQSAFVGIGAIGMTLVIMGGGIDLSVPGVLALTAVTATITYPTLGLILSIIVSLTLGLFLGLINGVIITKLNIPPFIATLGLGYIYLFITYYLTNQTFVVVTSDFVLKSGISSLFGIPVPFLIFILLTFIFSFISSKTNFGRFIKAVGSNEKAAIASGIPVKNTIVLSYSFLGLLVAISGILLSGYLSMADGNMGSGYDLNTIAATVVGGTSLAGGKGKFTGTFAGALLFTMISNGLDLFGIGSYWQYIATGLILIGALTLDALRND